MLLIATEATGQLSAIRHQRSSTRSEEWGMAREIAERMGCDFPGEPAGEALREGVWARQAGKIEPGIEVRVPRVVAECDACYGFCTVPQSFKRLTNTSQTEESERSSNNESAT